MYCDKDYYDSMGSPKGVVRENVHWCVKKPNNYARVVHGNCFIIHPKTFPRFFDVIYSGNQNTLFSFLLHLNVLI
jgi:hypothetical protein